MLAPGTAFGEKYRIVRRVAAGGMGAVYEVVHRQTQRHLALKLLLPHLLDDEDARHRFAQESSLLSTSRSAHLVPIIDAGVDPATDCPYLVMELLQGEQLADVVQRSGPLRPERALSILWQLAVGLEEVHACGIVHRDLKPENLFLTQEGGADHLKILDFGIAKRLGGDRKTTLALGTPEYMSPEQVRGDHDLDVSVDVYAFAQIAFYLLVGRSYFSLLCRADTPTHHQLLLRASVGPTVAPSLLAEEVGVGLVPAFDEWFRKAAHRNAQQRYHSIRAVTQGLQWALSDKGAPSRLSSGVRATILLAGASAGLGVLTSKPPAVPRDPVTVLGPRVAVPGDRVAQAAAVPGFRSQDDAISHEPLATHRNPPRVSLVDVQRPSASRTFGQASASPGAPAPKPQQPGSCDPPYDWDHGVKRYRSHCLTREEGEVSSRCDPPYVIEANGIKRYQSACLAANRAQVREP